MLSLDQIRAQAESILGDTGPGQPLARVERQFVRLAVCVSAASLNPGAMREAIVEARALGATDEQVHEIIALVSGLGVHSFMVAATMVVDQPVRVADLDDERRALWDRYVGTNPYWVAFERECPGFLAALLVLSPASFQGFFDCCAIAWATRSVPAVVKELAAMACDATPQHRFGPGFRLHLRNACKLGAGRLAVSEVLAIAAEAPDHSGVV